MSSTRRATLPKLKYHTDAYRFVFAALQYTQEKLDRVADVDPSDLESDHDEEFPAAEHEAHAGHISGGELLEGIREFALQEFGLLALTVFKTWGISVTRDFGEIVFELVERGEMRATDSDCIEDFENIYDFTEALDAEYQIGLHRAV